MFVQTLQTRKSRKKNTSLLCFKKKKYQKNTPFSIFIHVHTAHFWVSSECMMKIIGGNWRLIHHSLRDWCNCQPCFRIQNCRHTHTPYLKHKLFLCIYFARFVHVSTSRASNVFLVYQIKPNALQIHIWCYLCVIEMMREKMSKRRHDVYFLKHIQSSATCVVLHWFDRKIKEKEKQSDVTINLKNHIKRHQ